MYLLTIIIAPIGNLGSDNGVSKVELSLLAIIIKEISTCPWNTFHTYVFLDNLELMSMVLGIEKLQKESKWD